MDREGKDIQKYLVLWKNSAFVVMRDCKCNPCAGGEGALQLSTLQWRRPRWGLPGRAGARSQRDTVSTTLLSATISAPLLCCS